jgi:hypothetical protein
MQSMSNDNLRTRVGGTCLDCVHFEDDPARIEAELTNIGILGSAWSSARGSAGICRELGRLGDPVRAESCPWFLSRLDEASS